MKDAAGVSQPLHIRNFGTGPRPVLALHCTVAHSGAWRGLAAALDGVATIHAPDMLCHGRSPDWDGQGDLHDRMTAAVLDHLTQPMDLVGHSFGATLALRIAAERPELVRSLAIIESVHFAFARDDAPDLVRDEKRSTNPVCEAVLAGDLERAAQVFIGDWGDADGPVWADLPEAARQTMARGVQILPHCSPAIHDDRPGLLMPGGLDGVTMPVLLLRGGLSQPLVAATHDCIARRLPGADNRVVAAAGHMLPISHPGETAAALRDLFACAPD